MMNTSTANGHLFTNYPSLFDYSTAPASHLESFANILDKVRFGQNFQLKNKNNDDKI